MALGTNATTMSQFGDEGVLPTPMATEIMRNAYGQSIIGQVSGTTPMPITGTSIAMQTGDPVAGIVGEGELKPVVKTGVTTKVARPIKAAAMVYWSTELVGLTRWATWTCWKRRLLKRLLRRSTWLLSTARTR